MTLPQANPWVEDAYRTRSALVEYLRAKVIEEDWHAVRDACVDIEILEARIDMTEGA